MSPIQPAFLDFLVKNECFPHGLCRNGSTAKHASEPDAIVLGGEKGDGAVAITVLVNDGTGRWTKCIVTDDHNLAQYGAYWRSDTSSTYWKYMSGHVRPNKRAEQLFDQYGRVPSRAKLRKDELPKAPIERKRTRMHSDPIIQTAARAIMMLSRGGV